MLRVVDCFESTSRLLIEMLIRLDCRALRRRGQDSGLGCRSRGMRGGALANDDDTFFVANGAS